MKSPAKVTKQNSVDPELSTGSGTNPFDSDAGPESKQTLNAARRTSSEPVLVIPNSMSSNPFDDDDDGFVGKRGTATSSASKDRYKNDFRDSGGLENQSVQELENYAVYKAEETTKSVNNCLKIAEDIRGDATRTLDMLHQQGEQIERTHRMAADMDKDLSKVGSFLVSIRLLSDIFSFLCCYPEITRWPMLIRYIWLANFCDD